MVFHSYLLKTYNGHQPVAWCHLEKVIIAAAVTRLAPELFTKEVDFQDHITFDLDAVLPHDFVEVRHRMTQR